MIPVQPLPFSTGCLPGGAVFVVDSSAMSSNGPGKTRFPDKINNAAFDFDFPEKIRAI
jgi:hypothetical protein